MASFWSEPWSPDRAPILREFGCRVQLSLCRAWDCMAFGRRAPSHVRPDAGHPSPPASSVALIMASPAGAGGDPDKHRLPSRPPGVPQTPTRLGRLAAPAKPQLPSFTERQRVLRNFPVHRYNLPTLPEAKPHTPNLLLQDLPAVRPSR